MEGIYQGINDKTFCATSDNQIRYSAPMGNAGEYFQESQNKWLAFYNDELQQQRLKSSIKAKE